MTATVKITPGLRMTASPTLPVLDLSEESFRIAALPGRRHLFEPDRMTGSPLSGSDRVTSGLAISTPSTGPTVAPSASANNQPLVTKTAAHAAFAWALSDRPAPKSFTILAVHDISAARISAGFGTAFWGFFNGTNVKYSLNYRADNQRIQFSENFAANTSPNLIPAVNTPAGGQLFISITSYDATARRSRMGINSPDVLADLVHTGTNQPVIDAETKICVGGHMQGGSINLDGRLGRVLVLEEVYHDAAYLPLLAREIAELKEKYAI